MRGSFGGLDSRQPRGRDHIAFCDAVPANQRNSFLLQRDMAFSDSRARAQRFRGHVHHLGAAIGRDVRETFHPPIATIIRPG